jgi:murein DD-endopeptidase MepM/ murein hydrolase activator NlpD
MTSIYKWAIGLLTCSGLLLSGSWIWQHHSGEQFGHALETTALAINQIKDPVYKYGLNLSEFVVIDQKVSKNEAFADILFKHNVAYQSVKLILGESKKIFNLNKIQAGNKYAVLGENTDTGFVPKKIVYEENKVDYVVFNLEDSLYIYRGQNKVQRHSQEVAGVVDGSLYGTFDDMGIPPALAVRLGEIFSSTIDFYKIQAGDKFKIIYDQDFIDGKPIGVGAISAVMFENNGKNYYAYYYEHDKAHEGAYYDEQGNSMRKQFLKAPLKFFRISSHYSLNRFHPVDKVWRAHLGTDYAASYGTPIIATADGTIEEAQFGVYNGNYVKIRHNGQYKTQYLHMSKIGAGVRRGRHVHQGDIIGYVGSTGLATGPHVCYRFWKDGQQVDPFKQKLKFNEPMPSKLKGGFMAKTKSLFGKLDHLAYGTRPINPADEERKRLEAKYNPEQFVHIMAKKAS